MQNYFIYIGVALGLCLLLTFSLVLPKYRALNSVNREIVDQEITLASQEKYFQEVERVSEQLAGNKVSLSKIDSALPEGFHLAELLGFLQKTASQSGLILDKISPLLGIQLDKEKQKQGFTGAKINLVLQGRYSGFKKFLSLVEKSSRLIEVENANFTYDEIRTTFNLTTKIYSR